MNEILKFEPIFKSVIWGGKRIADFKGMPSQGENVGESWEISPMPGFVSVVAEGKYKGKSLNELISEYGNDIMGGSIMRKYNGLFPLLIKLIDSADDLSVQVHPDDALAAKRHGCPGKTEMWYSISPTEGSYLYAGFSKNIDSAKFRREVAENQIVSSLHKYFTRPGDVFLIPAGRVHSLGPGNLVLEIQEASDITYRIYDYDRRDAKGNPRQLHVEESIEAINFNDCDHNPVSIFPAHTGKTETIASCDYFTSELSGIDGTMTFDLAARDSFTVMIALEGNMTVDADGNTTTLCQGETILVPATVSTLTITGKGSVISVIGK